LQKQDIKSIEDEVAKLECKIKEMEDSFGPDTDFKSYRAYDELSKQIDILYKKWENAMASTAPLPPRDSY